MEGRSCAIPFAVRAIAETRCWGGSGGSEMSGLSVSPLGSSYSLSYAQNAGSGAASNFQQLGQALQAGNLSAARAAFSGLQKTFQIQTSLTQSSSWKSLVGSVNKIAQALDSGNLTAAQATYANLQQDLQMLARNSNHVSVTRINSSTRK
jgi:soluble cytochrome b562